jgi:hypothetical protein
MKRPALWLVVLMFFVLFVGVIWYPGYEPYRGPNSVECHIDLGSPGDPFRDLRGVQGFNSISTTRGMTIRDVIKKSGIPDTDLNRFTLSVERWASWDPRRATNRRLVFASQVVRLIPIEALGIWWEGYSKGRYNE